MKKIKKHLETANMNYFQHMYYSWKIGLQLVISFLTIIIHSINPTWFEYSTSKRIKKLYNNIKKK
jgi:hypothetical protein